MRLRLSGKKNIFEEIADTYKNYIMLGVLPSGEKLPSCRELAIELGINPNTVERAYALLEAEGLVVTIPKKGTFAAEVNHKKANILIETEKQLSALKSAGLSYYEVLRILDCVYKEELEIDRNQKPN